MKRRGSDVKVSVFTRVEMQRCGHTIMYSGCRWVVHFLPPVTHEPQSQTDVEKNNPTCNGRQTHVVISGDVRVTRDHFTYTEHEYDFPCALSYV